MATTPGSKPLDGSLYGDAVKLLERINAELNEHKLKNDINIRMVGVIKYLNDVQVSEITGELIDKDTDQE